MKTTTNKLERLNYIPGWENFFTFKPKGGEIIKIQLFNFTFEELEEGIFSNIEESIFKNTKVRKSVANIVAALLSHAVEHDYIHSLMRMDDYTRVPDNVHGFLVDFIWACAYIRNPKESTTAERLCAKRLLKRMAACASFDEMLDSCDYNMDPVDRPDHFDRSLLDILRRKHV